MEKVVSVFALHRDFTVKNRKWLFKNQNTNIKALKNVSFDIYKGEMLGLLGPNGAGKTTLTKILCTLLYPSKGTASVLDYNIVTEPQRIRPLINMVAGAERMLYFRLTAKENMQYFADLYNLPQKGLKEKIDELLGQVGLLERANSPVEGYSKGMRQRLQIAKAFLNDPLVLFLDEPTLGLDVQVARELRKLIRDRVNHNGMSVLLTTHYLHEADELCDRVAIIHHGEILTIETPKLLKKRYHPRPIISISVGGSNKPEKDTFRSLENFKDISIKPGAQKFEVDKPTWEITIEAGREDDISKAIQDIQNSGLIIYEAKRSVPSLEDVFVQIIGE
ncbi:MAG: ABC transporter ATP-binding protein [Candidatus Heimdallarchaeota archaeon]|nr:ABC transporter ATP-binding protein [Candidatus Heimdallarchaeota archaeon]